MFEPLIRDQPVTPGRDPLLVRATTDSVSAAALPAHEPPPGAPTQGVLV